MGLGCRQMPEHSLGFQEEARGDVLLPGGARLLASRCWQTRGWGCLEEFRNTAVTSARCLHEMCFKTKHVDCSLPLHKL